MRMGYNDGGRDRAPAGKPHHRWRIGAAVPVALVFTALSCGGGEAVTPAVMENAAAAAPHDASLTSVSPDEWRRLASRRIFFGHQSVGAQLVQGIQAIISARPQLGLRVVETMHAADVAGPAIMHASLGANYDPASKNAAFLAALDEGGATPDIAMYKFCYVDVTPATDPDTLFAQYVRTVERARAEHPELTIVHVTMPLTTAAPPGRLKGAVRRLLGRGPITEAENNVKRNRYNQLLRARYGAGRAPLFDLAKVESTRPDGSRSAFVNGTDSIYTLAPELSSDGGHLNEEGIRRAAEQLLVLLARL